MLHIMLLVFATVQTSMAGPCTKYGFKGFNYQRTEGGEDQYMNANEGVALSVKCFPLKVKAEDLINKLKKESSVRNTQGDAVYFEFNVRGRFKRVYVISRKPVLQLTFSTKRKNRAALDTTQYLVESYYRKSKVTY